MRKSISNMSKWIYKRRAAVLWSTILILAVCAVAVGIADFSAGINIQTAMPALPTILLLGLAGHFVHCFTRNLPKPSAYLSPQLRAIFIYAYLFQFFALATAGAPFFVSTENHSPNGAWAGVSYGCTHSEAGYGSELTNCDNPTTDSQWLLYIGSGPIEQEPTAVGGADSRVQLGRGLVVPLYVVVLSLIGGAVGMTRRLPEIQRQVARSSKDSGAKFIMPIEARERVLFQIMQVLATPLIAVVAFSAFAPDSVSVAVLLGFGAGFTSEAVLAKVRQLNNSIIGK